MNLAESIAADISQRQYDLFIRLSLQNVLKKTFPKSSTPIHYRLDIDDVAVHGQISALLKKISKALTKAKLCARLAFCASIVTDSDRVSWIKPNPHAHLLLKFHQAKSACVDAFMNALATELKTHEIFKSDHYVAPVEDQSKTAFYTALQRESQLSTVAAFYTPYRNV